ncbi:hypothetical protein AB0E75_25250 [Streptomyces griseoviridis]|jgi:uncharacterized protein YukE|uniref:Uncharacterized protein n=1 Tax=Streptomyces griseoviridis TaxID=45398 RepID=A0A918GQE4_STRGD|nr:hypothetical protein [Streptomyces niveoruber]GGS53528.1 hypothetical protein GCM10010238_48720 [Streptomyces niveoruber]
MAIQQSEERATRNGITALETAFTAVLRCQQDVQSTSGNLATAYQGADGGAFQKLLEQWDGHVDIILKNMDQMVDELNNTLKDNQLMQGSANEAIDGAYARSTSVFDALNGTTLSA